MHVITQYISYLGNVIVVDVYQYTLLRHDRLQQMWTKYKTYIFEDKRCIDVYVAWTFCGWGQAHPIHADIIRVCVIIMIITTTTATTSVVHKGGITFCFLIYAYIKGCLHVAHLTLRLGGVERGGGDSVHGWIHGAIIIIIIFVIVKIAAICIHICFCTIYQLRWCDIISYSCPCSRLYLFLFILIFSTTIIDIDIVIFICVRSVNAIFIIIGSVRIFT